MYRKRHEISWSALADDSRTLNDQCWNFGTDFSSTRFCDSNRLRLATPCRMWALKFGAQASRMNCFRGPTFRELSHGGSNRNAECLASMVSPYYGQCPNLLDAPTQTPFHAALGRAARHCRHYLDPFWRRRNGPSPCRQDERQYNQPGQQHARYKRIRCMQWVRLEMAASLCSPMHRGPHGSLLLADPIIYPKKHGTPFTSPGLLGRCMICFPAKEPCHARPETPGIPRRPRYNSPVSRSTMI